MLYRDDKDQISRDPHTKRLQTQGECLAKASKLPEVAYKPILIYDW